MSNRRRARTVARLSTVGALAVCFAECGVTQEESSASKAQPASQVSRLRELDDWTERTREVTRLSDEELRLSLAELSRSGWAIDEEVYLLEIVRRGGPSWVGPLREALDTRRGGKPGSPEMEATWRWHSADLGILTALRRVEGKSDPLLPIVEAVTPAEAIFPRLPTLRVSLKNVDRGREPFQITSPSHPSQWRIILIDETGSQRAVLRVPYSPISKCLSQAGLLLPRRSRDPVSLALGDLTGLPKPGRYKAVVQYCQRWGIRFHPGAISGEERVGGPIIWQSKPFTFTWKPREIRLSRGERDDLEALLPGLYAADPNPLAQAILWRQTIPWEQGSDAQTLAFSGFLSLPILLDALEEDADPRHRAWLLVMLGSASRINRPAWSEIAILFADDPDRWAEYYATAQCDIVAEWLAYREMIRFVD